MFYILTRQNGTSSQVLTFGFPLLNSLREKLRVLGTDFATLDATQLPVSVTQVNFEPKQQHKSTNG